MVLTSLIAPFLAKLFKLLTLSIIVFSIAFIVITMADTRKLSTAFDLGTSPFAASATEGLGTWEFSDSRPQGR